MEVYSWGGLTSQSKVRVLWLALLPFLFANLAGWMCSAKTRDSTWRFRLHRLAAGLGALALTVNAALIAVMISADVNAYQTTRAGLARHQWWLAPLGWHFIAGHPARQVMLGVLVPVLFVLALLWLARTTWRYEAVRPPYRITAERKEKPRLVTAAALATAWPTTSSGTARAASDSSPGCISRWSGDSWRSCSVSPPKRSPDHRTSSPWGGSR